MNLHGTHLSRRNFLAAVLAAGVTPRLPAQPASETAALAQTEKIMHTFVVDRMMDEDGLCRSMYSMATLAPWTNADLAKIDQWRITDMFQNSPDKAGCLTYENALMATGEFALSQIVRHRVTKEQAARDLAHRAICGILAVIGQGRYYMPGWLPKPYGGVYNARNSHEMSVDQYTKVIVALDAWRPLASEAERAVIDQFFIDAADFFVARKWRHAYRHRTIVTADTHLHALGLYVPLVVLAAKASGDDRYLKQFSHFDAAINRALTDQALPGFNGNSLIAEGYNTAMQAGSRDPRLPKMIAWLWQLGTTWIDEKGRGFIPGKVPEYDSQAPRFAALACIVESLQPAIHASVLARKILLANNDPAKMNHTKDMAHSLAEVSITSWLVAYWRLREARKV
jgi:hypothetical protein